MAKPVTMTVSHDLTQQEAQKRIHDGFEQVVQTLGAAAKFDQQWSGNTCHFTARALGQTVAGEVEVGEEDVRIEVRLPALLAGMADRIGGKLKKQSALLLEKK